MSQATLTRLPHEEAIPSASVDTLVATNGHSTNGRSINGRSINDHQSNGHSHNGSITKGRHAKWQIVLLPTERIVPNPWQPRTLFDPQEMEELTASVKAHGVQQPIIVRTAKVKAEDGAVTPGRRSKKAPLCYELVAGERRLRACIAAGRKSIPGIVRDDLSDLQVAEIALLENVQRSNLTAIEEAKGYRRLMLDFRLSEERLAKKVNKSVSVLREMMKLLALPEGVQQLIRLRKLTPAHGHELLRLAASPDVCNSVAAHAVNATLPASALGRDSLPNVRELEKRGFVVPLDYRTRFDKSQCKACPHKAHVVVGYASYCLKPEEWKRKQEETIEREKDEAARVLEEARRRSEAQSETDQALTQEGGGEESEYGPSLPVMSQLPRSSYRDLRFGEMPNGCSSACSCRGCALDPHASSEGEEEAVRVAICLDPSRFQELQREERARRDEEKRQLQAQRLKNALDVVHSAWNQERFALAASLAFTPFLDARAGRGHYMAPSQWELLVRHVADDLGMELPFEQLFNSGASDGDILRALSGDGADGEEETFGPQRLMLLGAGIMLALESEGAARWGGETPLLDFVLPSKAGTQVSLALAGSDEEERDETDDYDHFDEDGDEDPLMEGDFGVAFPEEVEETQVEETEVASVG